jgi:hypothetical protein
MAPSLNWSVRRTSRDRVVKSRFATLLLPLLTVACGYALSGRWEEDPKNWWRAFRSAKPGHVVVVHSLYWRSPHWTYEAGYAFEIKANQKFRDQLFRDNELRQVQERDTKSLCFSCPAWFAPGALDRYDVWAYAKWPDSKFRVLVDKVTGNIFLTDYQV